MVDKSMKQKKSILLMFHCEQNTGYAIGRLEEVFRKAAMVAEFNERNVLTSFSKVTAPKAGIYEIQYSDESHLQELKELIKAKNITTVMAFDLPFPSAVAKIAKAQGTKVISYWGASMSSINSGLKLLLKRAEWQLLQKSSANLFIFESQAMQLTATQGRGIPGRITTVIPLGVDTTIFYPSDDKTYIHLELNIPTNRKVVFYSGHMEERKGIRTIVKAAKYLAEQNQIANVHFVICGNKGNQADTYLEEIKNTKVLSHVTFAGYRNDIPELMRASDIGVIASTGWDSFTRSSVEMMAAGIPLLASNLGGLAETTKHNETGFLFEAGNYKTLAEKIYQLLTNDQQRNAFASAARLRAVELFDEKGQISHISKTLF
ncbi:MAG: glycosyltransferase involved in cell wall biosynthesis [Oceanospirillaceae bacterium]|jgi:glycosyltransferase involved in cell wall biosynthesis